MASSTLGNAVATSFLPVDELLNPRQHGSRSSQLPLPTLATPAQPPLSAAGTGVSPAPAAEPSAEDDGGDPGIAWPSGGAILSRNDSAPAEAAPAEVPGAAGSGSGAPQLVVNPDTLALSTLSTDGATSVGFKMVTAATQAVAARTIMINGQVGPTIAARFYDMVGTSLYEAWQLFTGDDRTSLEGGDKRLRDLERTAKAMLSSVSGPQKQDFIHNVMAETAFRVMRNEVVRNTPDASKVASASQLFSAARDSALVQLAPGRGPYRDLRAACNLLSEQLAGAIGEGFNADGATTALAYVPVNSDPLNVVDIDRWTPEYNKGYLDPAAGAASGLQSFLTPQWGQVKTILGAEAIRQLVEDSPGPARFLLNPADTYSLRDRTITSNGVTQAISKELIGTLINPAFISQAEKVVQTSASLTPTEKLIAEFWEDGGGTPFPPGSMMELGKFASEKYNLNTEMDTKLFFGLGKALMTSSVACWATKLAYDSTRPLIAIRELGKLGLIGEIDPVTGRSQVQAYDRATQTTGMIFADEWQTYQTTGAGYTPPFPEYTSGHSTFSASAARMIELVTGRSDFGASISARSLIEKNRPETPTLNLSWATWDDAALQAANSRLYGGIHFESGNLDGRAMGQVIGNDVFARLQHFWG